MYNVSVKSLLPDLYADIDRLISENRMNGKNVYVFGKGIWGFAVTQYLHEKGIEIKCVLDNDMNIPEWKNSIKLSVLSDTNYKVRFSLPEEALQEYDEKAFVLISSIFYASQSNQLIKMGYEEGKHFVQLDKMNKIAETQKPINRTNLDSDSIKKYLLDLLKFLKKICEENNLTYYIVGGTLLGAVRYKGFIPWDDDVDISMPLQDYMKLHDIFKKNNNSLGKYSLYSMVDDSNCGYAYAKLLNTNTFLHLIKYPMDILTHICIDIFPLSGAPMPNDNEYINFINDIESFNSDWMKYRSYFGTGIYPFEKCREKWYELLERYDYNISSGISYIYAENNNFRVLDRKLYDHVVELEFEGELFSTLSGYKEYLKIAYGDYMTPPDNWQRFGKHGYIDCWVDNSLES